MLKINGKEIALEPKARAWRLVMQFADNRKNIQNADAVDEYCKVIAQVYGVSLDEVLDNLPLEDVIPTYLEMFDTVYSTLTIKLAKKNIEETPNTVETQEV